MEIVEAASDRERKKFIELPYSLYSQDPHYIPPLRKEVREQFSKKNPFFNHATVKYFLAHNRGKIVGRIASILNRRHIEFHDERAGFFGFFESVNDNEVAQILLRAVEDELRGQGMQLMRGPVNFSTNEECGFVIEGFDQPPMIMMPYNPPYYNTLMEQSGLRKAKDLFAFIHEMREQLPEKVLRVAALAEKRGVTVRTIDKNRFNEEMLVFREVYNSAWEKNWGFIPLTDEELYSLGARLKQIAVPDLTLIAEDNGTPVGFLGLLPDVNYVLRHMHGRLTPWSILKALYYSRKITDLRLLLLGVRREYRNKGVDALLIREGFLGVRKGGYKRIEFSWILEDNIAIQRIIEMIGATLYKRYRIYEKEIAH